MIKTVIHIADIHIPNMEDKRPYSEMLKKFLSELYKEIKDFSSTKIEITSSLGKTIITGENLVVSKMQDNEVLITGKIKMIQL